MPASFGERAGTQRTEGPNLRATGAFKSSTRDRRARPNGFAQLARSASATFPGSPRQRSGDSPSPLRSYFAAGWLRPFALAVALGLLAGLPAASSAVAAPCANEALRAEAGVLGLPNCRAYEQATPVDKNGNDIQGTPTSVDAAETGARVSYYVAGGMPGGVNSATLPAYLSERHGAGWKSSGLIPPVSSGNLAYVAGWTEDLTHAYSYSWFLDNFHVRLQEWSSTGGFRQITDERPGIGAVAVQFVGSTPGGGTIAFEEPFPEPNFEPTVSVWDAATETVTLASVFNDGTVPFGGANAGPYNWYPSGVVSGGAYGHYYTRSQHALSSDGSKLFFTEAEYPNQLYVRLNPSEPQSPLDSEGECTVEAQACTVQISKSQASTADPNGPQPAAFIGADAAGSTALFLSGGKLTDDATTGPNDEGSDLYRYDVGSGDLEDLTPNPSSPAGAEVVGVVGYSDDMSYVYFAANGTLTSGTSQGDCVKGEAYSVCDTNLYVWHAGSVSFVAPIHSASETGDVLNWLPTLEPASSSTNESLPTGQVSADGRTLLFGSQQNQTSFDSHGKRELYRYSADSGNTVCVSCNQTNTVPLGDAAVYSKPSPEIFIHLTAPRPRRNLSADGRRVLFDTPDSLLPQDTNEVRDVYQWEEAGSGSCPSAAGEEGCVYLISDGSATTPSYFAAANREGTDAFFFTRDQLVAQDKDRLMDIYDARVEGGLAPQIAVPPPPCASRAGCSPEPVTGSPAPAPASATFSGPGNPHHKKKKHRKKHRRHKKGSHGRKAQAQHKPAAGHTRTSNRTQSQGGHGNG